MIIIKFQLKGLYQYYKNNIFLQALTFFTNMIFFYKYYVNLQIKHFFKNF